MAQGQRTYGWSVVAILSFAYLVSILDRFLISVTLEPIRTSLGLSDTELGLLSGPAFAMLYALFCPILGRLADVANRCYLIAVGLLVWSLSTAAAAFADSFPALFASRALVGMGEAALVPAGTSLIAAYFARQELGRATGVFLAGAAIGKAVAFIGGGALLGALAAAGGLYLGWHFSAWQALFLLAAAPGLGLAALFTILPDPGHHLPRADHPRLTELLSHVRTRKLAYALHITCSTIVVLASSVFLTWSPSFYARRFGMPPSEAAMLAGVATACAGPLGYWIGGAAMDLLRRKGVSAAPTWIIAASLAVAGPACVLFTSSGSLWPSVVGYGIAQLAVQAPGAPAVVGVQLLTPPPHRGFMVGVYLVVVTLGSIGLGPALIGVANDRLFAGTSLGLSILLVVGSFCVLGAMLAAFNGRPYARAALETAERRSASPC